MVASKMAARGEAAGAIPLYDPVAGLGWWRGIGPVANRLLTMFAFRGLCHRHLGESRCLAMGPRRLTVTFRLG